IERVVPGDGLPIARPLVALAAQRLGEPAGMVHAFRVARDLGADHARRVGVVGGAADAPDGASIEHLDLERAGGRTVVRAGRGGDAYGGADDLVHRASLPAAGA